MDILDLGLQSSRDLPRFPVGLRHQDDKFVAAVSNDVVRRAHFLTQLLRHSLQDLVSPQVPESIVHSAEPIDIDHHQRQRMRVSIGPV